MREMRATARAAACAVCGGFLSVYRHPRRDPQRTATAPSAAVKWTDSNFASIRVQPLVTNNSAKVLYLTKAGKRVCFACNHNGNNASFCSSHNDMNLLLVKHTSATPLFIGFIDFNVFCSRRVCSSLFNPCFLRFTSKLSSTTHYSY